MYLFVVGLVLALSAGSYAAEPASPVNVTVYYESLCPDSIKFYTKQLYPTMEIANISNLVLLELIPYGKSTHRKAENGSWIFECHHGERECYGNKVHACALKLMASKNERLSYLNCLLAKMRDNRQAVFPVEQCADEIRITEKDAIITCANGTEADALLAEMGNKTQMLQPKLSSVPTVVFNNKYDQNDFQKAQSNFKGVLCKYLSYKPNECADVSASSALNASMVVLVAALSVIFSQH